MSDTSAHKTPPSFIVYKTTMLGFVPLGRIYYCINCEQDLSDWVMRQSPDSRSACPHCDLSIEGEHVAQAQRETKIGCLLSLAGFASLFLIPAAIVAVFWLVHSPGRDSVSRTLSERMQRGAGTTVDFAAIAPFAWDRVYFFHPYTPHDRIHATIGFQWDQASSTTIDWNEGVNLVVFVRGREVVHWFEHSRREELANLAVPNGYAPQQARFIVRVASEQRLKLVSQEAN